MSVSRRRPGALARGFRDTKNRIIEGWLNAIAAAAIRQPASPAPAPRLPPVILCHGPRRFCDGDMGWVVTSWFNEAQRAGTVPADRDPLGENDLVILAEVDGRIMGAVVFGARSNHRAWIDFLFVEDRARRNGIATELMRRCLSYCGQQLKCRTVMLGTGIDNSVMRSIATRLGMVPTATVFTATIGVPPAPLRTGGEL